MLHFAREISAESAENSRFRAGSYYSLLPREKGEIYGIPWFMEAKENDRAD